MANDNPTVTKKRFRGDSAVISIRLPKTLITRVDEIAAKTGRARNELIEAFVQCSVSNLTIQE